VQGRRGLQVRDLVEPFLRPLSLRLRVSRRDQEHARQILLALQRMVPARQVRRSLAHALVRRPAFADALATLRCLGVHLGGEVADAAAFWTEAAAGREPVPPAAETVVADGSRPATAEPRRRRRRGGRGRQQRRDEGGEAVATTEPARPAPDSRRNGRERAPAPRPESRPGMPPPWDDNYFFAALPTVPDLGDADPGDRYGAATVASPMEETETEAAGAAEAAAGAEPAGGAGARRRRRRRPRRRRPAGDPGPATE
jgi:hypothetical protein